MADGKPNGKPTQEPTRRMVLMPVEQFTRLNRNLAMLEAQLQTLKEDLGGNFLIRPYTQSQLMAFEMEAIAAERAASGQEPQQGQPATPAKPMTQEQRLDAARTLAASLPPEGKPDATQ